MPSRPPAERSLYAFRILADSDPQYVPAIKIARLAVCKDFRAGNSGTGRELVRLACWLGLAASRAMGCRLVTVDAYPDAVPFYEDIGFVHNSAGPYKGNTRPSMRLDLFSPEIHGWLLA